MKYSLVLNHKRVTAILNEHAIQVNLNSGHKNNFYGICDISNNAYIFPS